MYVCSKVKETTEVINQLQGRLPGSSTEKASKAELMTLLESHDTYLMDLESQQLTLGVLQQRALSMLQDRAFPGMEEEVPILRAITALQDQCLK